jgi:demethylmenaquinone methyltransferase/2-methoxy-6-polyprenyl-1,4-benzoquinol methylase
MSDLPSDSEAEGAPGKPRAERKVDFGYASIPEGEKTGRVRAVFERVAGRYDLMNDLMSLGVQRLWKRELVAALAPRPGETLLDLAGGTGDIAFRALARAPGLSVVVADLTPGMLAVGRDRAADRGLVSGLDWVCANAEALPFASRALDACTIAFGLRNVTRRERALAEIRRVLKPGGRFLCLEFSRVAVPLLGRLYDGYSFAVVPALGRLVTRDAESYRYLIESIRRFPRQEELARMMGAAGFERVSFRNLSGGIVAIHKGWRI